MTDFDPSNFDFNLPFDKWVKFVFDHPVNDDIKSAWYWDDKWRDVRDEWDWGEKANPELQLKHATQLFQDPAFLPTTYNPEQINHGFWFLLSGPSGFALNDLLWDATLSWPIREQCILAMVNVFRVIFIVLIDEDAGHMWWDLLLGGGYSAERDSKVKDAMFQAMTKILEIPSLVCQVCALHGLGHLEHVGKKTVIENYLLGNLDLEDNVREYALVAIEGKVL